MNLEIVAELAQGFEGSPAKASLLLQSAVNAGANAAKFQLIYADEISTPDYKFHNLFQSLEMTDNDWVTLKEQSSKMGVELQFDIFGELSLRKSTDLHIETVKIHPTDVTNLSLLEKISVSPIKRILVGVGGATSKEIDLATEILANKELVLILGFQSYPTPVESNQIARVSLLKQKYQNSSNIQIGFADHAEPESGFAGLLGAMSIGAGATLLEKHLTLNRVLKMEDHESALNPDEFRKYRDDLIAVSTAIGSPTEAEDFGMSASETSYRNAISRHVVSAVQIMKGQEILPEHLALKRSSVDQPITDLTSVYHSVATRTIDANSAISAKDFTFND
jgi:N,N'-diacetyllegionaminate synthase